MAIILDGRIAADAVLKNIKNEIETLKLSPKLAIVLVGDNPASEIYIKNKNIRAEEIGIATDVIRLPAVATITEILDTVHRLNANPKIHGIIVQAPLPNVSMENAVFNNISAEKDVDGFCDINMAKLIKGDLTGFIPCTALGILHILKHYNIRLNGKHVVVIGRSNVVGRPLSLLLSQKSEDCNATVTLCHSGTENLRSITQMADIIIAAIGQKNFLTKDMISQGAVIIDVGINRSQIDSSGNYIVSGDVDFDQIKDICSAITPVPGGVGPMTVAMLMSNTLLAAKRK